MTIPWRLLTAVVTFPVFSLWLSILTLKESSITFAQLSRLMILPLSAGVDYVLYGKRRGSLEYFSLVLLSYGVYMGSRGDVAATFLAAVYASLAAVCTLGSSATTGHMLKITGYKPEEVLPVLLPYEIALSLVILLGSHVRNSYSGVLSSTDHEEESYEPLLLLRVVANAAMAILVVYLTVWAQGKASNMVYAVIGQCKTALTLALGAALLHETVSMRAMMGLMVIIAISIGLAAGDVMKNAETTVFKPRWSTVSVLVFALVVICADMFDLTQPQTPTSLPLPLIHSRNRSAKPLRMAFRNNSLPRLPHANAKEHAVVPGQQPPKKRGHEKHMH